MDCTDLYLKINHNLQENIQASLSSSHYALFANANAFIDDYGLWQKWIAEKYGIEIFSLALSEYETALLFAVQSLYKQAFSSLRAYLEHTLFGIQLTTNLLQYLNWKQDAQDVYWSQIVDLDSGLFSSNYTSAFFSELYASSKLILDLAKRVYRECSQFTLKREIEGILAKRHCISTESSPKGPHFCAFLWCSTKRNHTQGGGGIRDITLFLRSDSASQDNAI